MTSRFLTGKAELMLLGEVEQELAPILQSDYTARVMLSLSRRIDEFVTPMLFFHKALKIERGVLLYASISFDPCPLNGEPKFKMEVGDPGRPKWTAQADTAEEALASTKANAKHVVAEERAARRSAQADRLAAYDRRRAEASA